MHDAEYIDRVLADMQSLLMTDENKTFKSERRNEFCNLAIMSLAALAPGYAMTIWFFKILI